MKTPRNPRTPTALAACSTTKQVDMSQHSKLRTIYKNTGQYQILSAYTYCVSIAAKATLKLSHVTNHTGKAKHFAVTRLYISHIHRLIRRSLVLKSAVFLSHTLSPTPSFVQPFMCLCQHQCQNTLYDIRQRNTKHRSNTHNQGLPPHKKKQERKPFLCCP